MNIGGFNINLLVQKIRDIENALQTNNSDNVQSFGNLTEILQEVQTVLSAIVNSKNSVPSDDSNDKYRLIFENAPVGIFKFNSNGVITDCNSNFADVIGSSKKVLIGLNMTALPDKKLVKALTNVLAGKSSSYEGFYTSQTANKTTPVRVLFEPSFNVNNEPSGGIGIVEDYTEKIKSDAALLESEDRYLNLFKNNNNAMLIIDPTDGSVFDANPAAENFYGWKTHELRKKKITQIYSPSDSELKKEIEAAMNRKKNLFQFRHKLADGSEKDVEVYSDRIPIAGKEYLYAIIHDISDRVKVEQDLKKFRLGINRSSNAVFITNTEGVIEYVNPAFENLYGYSSDEAVGKTPRILKSGNQSNEFYEEFWNKIVSGEVSKGEIINKTKSGELLTISFSSNPIINDDGKIIGFIAIQDNITERKKMEGHLRQALYEKEVMLAEIHHRVKNNLAMVSAMMMLQAEHADNEDLKNKLQDSTNRIKAIANIHEHLYESSSFSHINFTENLLRLIKNIVNTLQTSTKISVENSRSQITLNVNQAVYCSLILNEVVTNIVKHAFENRESGLIKLDTTEKNEEVIIQVSDNGNPLPEGFQSANFGSLGMELIHILTRQLDADINYTSRKKGTLFTLSFQKNTIE